MVKATATSLTLYGYHGKAVGSTLAKAEESLEDTLINLCL